MSMDTALRISLIEKNFYWESNHTTGSTHKIASLSYSSFLLFSVLINNSVIVITINYGNYRSVSFNSKYYVFRKKALCQRKSLQNYPKCKTTKFQNFTLHVISVLNGTDSLQYHYFYDKVKKIT
jgi:hypothetical protein